MDRWNIIFNRGATYQQTITLAGVADIATATDWVVRCAMPDSAPFVTATIENGMMIPTEDANSYVMQVSAADTLEFPLGNGRFDFEVWFPGDIVRRYVAGAFVQVNPEVGAA